MNFFFEMKALGRQAAMHERDILRYIIRGVTDDERQQVMLCAARTYEDLRDHLKFMGNSLTAPRVKKNYKIINYKMEQKPGKRRCRFPQSKYQDAIKKNRELVIPIEGLTVGV